MIEVSKIYKVSHSRKGLFTMQVTKIDDTWIEGVIVDGKASALSLGGTRYQGDPVTVRKSLCTFEEVR